MMRKELYGTAIALWTAFAIGWIIEGISDFGYFLLASIAFYVMIEVVSYEDYLHKAEELVDDPTYHKLVFSRHLAWKEPQYHLPSMKSLRRDCILIGIYKLLSILLIVAACVLC